MDDALVSGIMSVGIYRGLNALAYLFFCFAMQDRESTGDR